MDWPEHDEWDGAKLALFDFLDRLPKTIRDPVLDEIHGGFAEFFDASLELAPLDQIEVWLDEPCGCRAAQRLALLCAAIDFALLGPGPSGDPAPFDTACRERRASAGGRPTIVTGPLAERHRAAVRSTWAQLRANAFSPESLRALADQLKAYGPASPCSGAPEGHGAEGGPESGDCDGEGE